MQSNLYALIHDSLLDGWRFRLHSFQTVSSLQVFQRVLKAYATKLFLKLPKGGTGIVAAATGMDGQIKVLSISSFFLFLMSALRLSLSFFIFSMQVSDRDERVICYIVNSAEYCHKTVSLFFVYHSVTSLLSPLAPSACSICVIHVCSLLGEVNWGCIKPVM